MLRLGMVFVAYGNPGAREAARSARATAHTSLEIVIVDNPTRDNKPPQVFPEERVLRPLESLGYASALNAGAGFLLNCDYLALCNDDLYFDTPDWDVPLIEALQDPTVGLVGPRMTDGNGRLTSPPTTGPYVNYLMKDWLLPDGPRWRRSCEVPMVQGSMMMLRQEVFEGLGGMTSDFPFYCEDDDLALKVWRSGKRVLWVGQSHVVHYGGKSAEDAQYKLESLEKGRRLLQERHGEWVEKHPRVFEGPHLYDIAKSG